MTTRRTFLQLLGAAMVAPLNLLRPVSRADFDPKHITSNRFLAIDGAYGDDKTCVVTGRFTPDGTMLVDDVRWVKAGRPTSP